jgi:hypothetical protein
MGILAGFLLLSIVVFGLVFAALAWTQKKETEWDLEDTRNSWDWHR